jgi:chaperonin GroES
VLTRVPTASRPTPGLEKGIRAIFKRFRHYISLRRITIMKVKPLYDRILVRRVEAEEKVKGGIIIPDTAKEKPLEGKVVAVGAGRLDDDGKRIKLEVKAGDRVLIGKYAGTEIRIEDKEHVIVREDEVLGVIS